MCHIMLVSLSAKFVSRLNTNLASLLSENNAVGVMKPGHCFTIEPMISEGTWRDVSWPDDWTAVTADGLFSAQFEQTLLVTETGCDILTKRRTTAGTPHFMDKM